MHLGHVSKILDQQGWKAQPRVLGRQASQSRNTTIDATTACQTTLISPNFVAVLGSLQVTENTICTIGIIGQMGSQVSQFGTVALCQLLGDTNHYGAWYPSSMRAGSLARSKPKIARYVAIHWRTGGI